MNRNSLTEIEAECSRICQIETYVRMQKERENDNSGKQTETERIRQNQRESQEARSERIK